MITARTAFSTAATAVLASVCLFAAAGPALAATPRSVAVSYADLDLSHSAGRMTLNHRIQGAARSVCATGAVDLATKGFEDRCVRDAVAKASRPAAI